MRQIYLADPKKAQVRHQEWVKNHPDQATAHQQKYHKKNIVERNARSRKWAEENTALASARSREWYKENKVQAAATRKAWCAANPEKKSSALARYRATKFQATPAWADKAQIESFYYTANMLGMHTGEWYHVDHVVPLKSRLVCGLHCENNLQILSGSENCSKGNYHWPGMPVTAY